MQLKNKDFFVVVMAKPFSDNDVIWITILRIKDKIIYSCFVMIP